MKTENVVVTTLSGLAAGVVGTLVLSPSYKTSAAWVSSDPSAIGLARGVLQQNRIPYELTKIWDQSGIDQTVLLQGPQIPAGGRLLYILLVKEADQVQAEFLIRESQ